jgi:hypothetical protein
LFLISHGMVTVCLVLNVMVTLCIIQCGVSVL